MACTVEIMCKTKLAFNNKSIIALILHTKSYHYTKYRYNNGLFVSCQALPVMYSQYTCAHVSFLSGSTKAH